MFIKVAVSCKTKPSVYIIKESESLLKHVNHEEFKQHLLPAMQKAMLRNPEIILECVGHVMSGLSLDLSQYAPDIGKSLAGEFIVVLFINSVKCISTMSTFSLLMSKNRNVNKIILYRNRFVTQYITYLNIWEVFSGTLYPLSTHDRLILV